MRTEYKGYYIAPHKETPNILYIATTGKGGKIPDVLSGFFTATGVAQKAIDKYLETRKVKDGETISKG